MIINEYEWKELERQKSLAALQHQEEQAHKQRVEWCVWNWINSLRNEK
mgnify:CR=1 FL=1